MGLFLDLLRVPASVTNETLEGLYKALSDGHDHGKDGIWKPHDSPLVQRLIELFTERGLLRLDAVRSQFLAWKSGANHKAADAPPAPPPGILPHWSHGELALARLYLESLPPSLWTLDDHMLAIEYVVQSYLPADALLAEADWLATKASMLGKVQANLEKPPTLAQADAILAAMPSSATMAAPLSAVAQNVLVFARQRVAENVRALSDGVRHRMRVVVASHLEAQSLGLPPAGSHSLETKLLDEFGEMNRDWRRIAVTEAGEAQLQGFIASLPTGTLVKRVERYDGACAFCRRIDGAVAEVVSPDHPKKDPDRMVWPGKNNVGRSASPKKRVGDVLVDRDPEEMWWLPAGLAHPHCRGRWVLAPGNVPPGGDPAFAAELAAILGSS